MESQTRLASRYASIGRKGQDELDLLQYIKIRSEGPLPKANTFNLHHHLAVIQRMEFMRVLTLLHKSSK